MDRDEDRIVAFDSHCHADIMISQAPEFPEMYISSRVGGITWSYAKNIVSFREYPLYWNRLRSLCEDLHQQGFPFYYLVGIHPRSIPSDLEEVWKLPEEITSSLMEHMNSLLCLGIGEIGFDRNSQIEERILRLQLEWAEEHIIPRKRIGIHTPRHNKEEVTRITLKLLLYYEPLHPFTVIDHVTPETFSYVYEQGYAIGMTLQEGKCSIKDVYTIAERYGRGVRAVMLNSDSARRISEPFFAFIADESFPDPDIKRGLIYGHCVTFFGIDYT